MIKVLIVEDSPVVREFLSHVLGSDPQIRVVGTAANGEEALEAAGSKKPDVITMDIHMPKMDGFEATRRIMETTPVPIIIVSGSSTIDEVATTFRALEMGALTVVAKPNGVGHAGHDASARELIQAVKLMSEVKVVKRWARPGQGKARNTVAERTPARRVHAARIDIVAIGASTGGPQVLHTILSGLTRDFPAPLLIVQHIAAGFLQGLVDWLADTTVLPVSIAQQNMPLRAGHVYIAPDGLQMGVKSGGVALLFNSGAENGHLPSVSFLFRSIAHVYRRHSAGILLTGMGRDGADGLKLMREQGALTMVQDAKSSIVHGMPGEAIKLDAASYVLNPEEITVKLKDYVIQSHSVFRDNN